MKEVEVIHWWNFPKRMYIRLPKEYRTIFFQLAILELGGDYKATAFIKKNNLKANLSRWKFGFDKDLEQLINLDTFLFLVPYVEKRIKSIINKHNQLNNKLQKFNKNRFPKDDDLISLIKDIRYVVGGNKNLSRILKIKKGLFESYINKSKIKRIPLNLIKNIFKFIEQNILCYSFSLEEIENKIISYKSFHGKEIIVEYFGERKLPIKITPEFDSILYHLFGDGYVSKTDSGEYTQLNMISKSNFLIKLYRTFGYFDMPEKGFNDGRIYISKTIIKIIKDYYKLETKDFLWYNSKLPNIIFTRPNSFKLAGVLAFIIDEAYVGKSNITIHLSNKLLLSQIREIFIENNILCGEIKLKKGMKTTKDSFRFNILKESIASLVIKVNELKALYPTCNFAHKEEKIMKIIN